MKVKVKFGVIKGAQVKNINVTIDVHDIAIAAQQAFHKLCSLGMMSHKDKYLIRVSTLPNGGA